MKKVFFSIALFCALLSTAKAQNDTLRQEIHQPIAELNISGHSVVKLFKSDNNYIDVVVNGTSADSLAAALPKEILQLAGKTLSIHDNEGGREYLLHLSPKQFEQYSVGPFAQLDFDTNDFKADHLSQSQFFFHNGAGTYVIDGDTLSAAEYKQLSKKKMSQSGIPIEVIEESSLPEMNGVDLDAITQPLIDRLTQLDVALDTMKSASVALDTLFHIYSDAVTQLGDRPLHKLLGKEGYSYSDRSDIDFLWGFTNWGSSPFNGLMKMDGPYNLRTSFSSYQLGWNYAVVMTPHWQLKVGVNYESDVYKFSNDFVDFTESGLAIIPDAERPVQGGSDWSSRLVARYVSLPITVGYRSNDRPKHFRVDLAVVPGLAFNGEHTGLKHCLEQHRNDYNETVDAPINPYKLDVRFDISRRWLKMFIQVPTMPLFADSSLPKIYPIKLGFMI